jgi:YD repeat-containing protein
MAIIALILSSVIAYAGSVTYTYDGLNRLIRADYEDGTVIQYIYDEAGNRTTVYVNTTPPTTTADPPVTEREGTLFKVIKSLFTNSEPLLKRIISGNYSSLSTR